MSQGVYIFASYFLLPVDQHAVQQLQSKMVHAKVSGHTASHTRSWPHFQGTIDTPSGRFPSKRYRPGGSRRELMERAATKALCMMSLKAEWGGGGTLHSFCSLSHVWQLRHWSPIEILTMASSMHSPSDDIGRAFNHAPDSLHKMPQGNELCAFDQTSVFAIDNTHSESHGEGLGGGGGGGGCSWHLWDQAARASST